MQSNTKIREKAKPFFIDAGSGTLAILVHGFTGSPYDMKELAEFLVSKGISVKVPLLAGHGSHWTQLEKTSYFDWWETVENELKNSSKRFKKIFLVGYSFGGNLSLDLAARYPDIVDGITTMGVSVFLRKELLIKMAMPFFHLFIKKYKKKYVKKEYLYEYEDSGCYVMVPTKNVYDFYSFINNYTKRELHKIEMPSLIIHSRDDSITHPLSSQFVYDKINSSEKELLMLDDVNHNPLTSKRKDIIFNKINEFIQSV